MTPLAHRDRALSAAARRCARAGAGRARSISFSAPARGSGCSSRASSRSSSGSCSGCSPYAYPRAAFELERATERFREFREQPTAEPRPDARSQGSAPRRSPNERLQQLYHPWTSYVDRAAVRARERRHRGRQRSPGAGAAARRSRSGSCSATCSASRSASLGASWLVTRRAADGCARRSGGPRCSAAARSPASGSPSRCSIATLAFDGAQLDEAKAGVLASGARRGLGHVAPVPR